VFLKKVYLFTLILLFLLSPSAFAQEYSEEIYEEVIQDMLNNETDLPYDHKMWERKGKEQQKVNEIGFRLLNSNKFPRRVHFVINETAKSKQIINAGARYFDGRIKIYKGMFLYIDTDDELAAILSHELGHITQLSTGNWLWKRTKMRFAPKYYEHDADLKGIDYMVKAGYNPLAMITLFNKIAHEKSSFAKVILFLFRTDTHPSGSKRILKMYNYIQEKYPRFLSEENDNIYYINFLMNYENNDHIKLLKDKHDISIPVDMGENL